MEAVSIKNWAHIISTPAAMSWSADIQREVKARPTAARNEPMATVDSTFLSWIIVKGLSIFRATTF